MLDEYQASALQLQQFLPLQLDAAEQMGEYPASALVQIQYPALSLDVVQSALVQQSSDPASVLLQPFERQLLHPQAFFLSWPPLRQRLEHSGCAWVVVLEGEFGPSLLGVLSTSGNRKFTIFWQAERT